LLGPSDKLGGEGKKINVQNLREREEMGGKRPVKEKKHANPGHPDHRFSQKRGVNPAINRGCRKKKRRAGSYNRKGRGTG